MYVMDYQDGYGMHNGFDPFGGLISIVWWVLVVWAIVALVRWLMRQERMSHHVRPHEYSYAQTSVRALDILKERYAKGEITKEEFEAIKRDIA